MAIFSALGKLAVGNYGFGLKNEETILKTYTYVQLPFGIRRKPAEGKLFIDYGAVSL